MTDLKTGVAPIIQSEEGAVFETLPSTSDFCIELAKSGKKKQFFALTKNQTKGRGSRGRFWQSIPGNLYFSVFLPLRADSADLGFWALLAGLALAEALDFFIGTEGEASPVRLKWPNDLLLKGGKIGGILIDTGLVPGETPGKTVTEWMVIGFGANLAGAPFIEGRRTFSLADFFAEENITPSTEVSPEKVAEKLLSRLNFWQKIFLEGRKKEILQAWGRRGHTKDEELIILFQNQLITGKFITLSEEAGLYLKVEDEIKHFHTGEILQITPSRSPAKF